MNGMERRVARSLPTVDLPLDGEVGNEESGTEGRWVGNEAGEKV
jgi:hypothetical protein